MKMTPALLIVGGLMVFWTSVFVAVILPAATFDDRPSEIWRPWTAEEDAGNKLYVANGCSYCHSLSSRPFDWDIGRERVSQSGDYHQQLVAIVGTERTGPDLSAEGGQHSQDWHLAHFANPRYTRPMSLMPSWEFLGEENVRKLTAYVQAQGGKLGDGRVARQNYWQKQAQEAYQAGPDRNIEWIHSHVPKVWRDMPNPYPAEGGALERGHKVYQEFCIGCHGPVGDGNGPASRFINNPKPLNFTSLRGHLAEGKYIGGIFYYQIMNGITGTAMPYFKHELESEKIWDVSNYVAVYFVGYTDATIEPHGIDASYVPAEKSDKDPRGFVDTWRNTFNAPVTQPAGR